MSLRLSIDSVREHRQLVNFLIPSGTEFSPIHASTVPSVYDLIHGTVDGRMVEGPTEGDVNLTDLSNAHKDAMSRIEWVLKNFLPPLDSHGRSRSKRVYDVKFSRNPRIHPSPPEVIAWANDKAQAAFPISTQEGQRQSDLSLEFRPNVSLTYTSFTLPNGRPAVMLDIGSVDNIAGSKWGHMVFKYAAEHDLKAQKRQRLKPLTVSGVGHGCQQATHGYRLPCAFLTGEGADPTYRSRSRSSIHASLGMPSLPD